MSIKGLIIGTALGRFALSARDKLHLVKEAHSSPESVETMANDQLAGLLVTRLCLPSGTFVDVGAHIGSIIAEVVAHRPRATVIAFEAIADKARNLAVKFPQIKVHALALGDAEGSATFYVDVKNSGYSSLSKVVINQASTLQPIEVTIARLDKVLAREHVDVVKIDVEGAELGVLRGAEALISRCRPLFMFESGPLSKADLGFTKEAMFEFFAERSYQLIVPNRLAHNGPPLSLDAYLDSHWYPRRTTNYFAVPAERRDEYRDRARQVLGVKAA